jgi:agmatinase
MGKSYFIACDAPLDDADIVILGCPYDGTSSYRPGSRFGPSSIRNVSEVLETYSPYLNLDLIDKSVCDLGNLGLPFGDKYRVFDTISFNVGELLQKGKKVLALGGEHLISYPIIVEYAKHYTDLVVVHIDAHCDLRDDYLGEKYSHATVLRRIYDIDSLRVIYHFGMRSGTREEFSFGQSGKTFYPFNLSKINEVIKTIPDNVPIYITLDLDILDPSVLPGTGTPEAGGISFMELTNGLYSFRTKNVVGCDVVELSPDYDLSMTSSITAAKVVRELLLII